MVIVPIVESMAAVVVTEDDARREIPSASDWNGAKRTNHAWIL